MGTKILFYDDDGDLMMDIAMAAYIGENHSGVKGVIIDITGDTGIFIPYATDSLISDLWENDKYDLRSKGRVVWITSDGEWSDDPDDEDDEKEKEE